MTRIPVLRSGALLAGVLLVAACTADRATPPPSAPPQERVGVTSAVRGSTVSAVYAAVIRQLVTVDHGFGGQPYPYRRVYVLNGVVPSAANPMHLVGRPTAPFAPTTVDEISANLRALPPVSFVRNRGLVITGSGPGHVIHAGVLITLGRITWRDPRTAVVANNRWASGLNGQWLRYIVQSQDGTWRVIGVERGPVAIS